MIFVLKGTRKRMIWGAMMVVIIGLLLAHLSMVTLNFLTNEKNIDVRVAEARELEFPAVTGNSFTQFSSRSQFDI